MDSPAGTKGPGLSHKGSLLVFLGLAAWVAFFGAGIVVDTLPARLAVSPTNPSLISAAAERTPAIIEPTPSVLLAWIVVLCCYTPTNLAILCFVGGLVGTLGRQATLDVGDESEPPLDVVNPLLSALIRGFFVYLVVISGVLLLLEDPFANPSVQQYLRLAGFLSVLSFVVNYNPIIFARVLGWIVLRLESRVGGTPTAPPPAR